VEFIVDQAGPFYFMEMNTRLQVEHPVTEMITGLDLVEWQLRVAAGERLPLTQEQVSIRGHAIEARIYAEDPDRNFLPSTGELVHVAPPRESLHVRVDTGVEQGDAITPYYDPLIAKLIVWDWTREQALARMLQSLAQFQIAGVTSNVAFLARLVACPAFSNAELDTVLIERERDYLSAESGKLPPDALLVAALATLLREADKARTEAARSSDPHSPWHSRDGWRLNSQAERSLLFRHQDAEIIVRARYESTGFRLVLDGVATFAQGELGEHSTLQIDLGGRRFSAAVVVAREKRVVFLNGRTYVLSRIDPLRASDGASGPEGGLVAPMPGRIVALLAQPGARVGKGAPLIIMESMKMELTLAAPSAGMVRAFPFAVGSLVAEGVQLVDFEANSAAACAGVMTRAPFRIPSG
jgi:3-methylcrotonyl-CoA carboxylase alpha subunit